MVIIINACIQILPTSVTKAELWRQYKAASGEGVRIVQLSSFRQLWRQLVPFIVIGKPMSDLCWVGQRNNQHIRRAVNIPEEAKSEALRLLQEAHLLHATAERSFYQKLCADSRALAELRNITQLSRAQEQLDEFHYSFDFAQQIHYPAD